MFFIILILKFIQTMKRHQVKRDIAPSAGFIDIYVRRQTCDHEEKAENITHPTQ